jgi:hypothetical protein
MGVLHRICDDTKSKCNGAKTVIGFHNSIEEMQQKWARGERKPLEVIRGHEAGKSTEEAVRELGQTMDTTHKWDSELIPTILATSDASKRLTCQLTLFFSRQSF